MAKSTPINYLFDVPTSDGHCTDPSHSSSVVCLPNREDRSITLFAQIFFLLPLQFTQFINSSERGGEGGGRLRSVDGAREGEGGALAPSAEERTCYTNQKAVESLLY